MSPSLARPNGRPRATVRLALAAWACEWRSSGRAGGLTVVELASVVPGMSGQSRSDCRMVAQTVRAMLRYGELVRVGVVPSPHRRRPRCLYGPPKGDAAKPVESTTQASAQLAVVLGALWSAAPCSGGSSA